MKIKYLEKRKMLIDAINEYLKDDEIIYERYDNYELGILLNILILYEKEYTTEEIIPVEQKIEKYKEFRRYQYKKYNLDINYTDEELEQEFYEFNCEEQLFMICIAYKNCLCECIAKNKGCVTSCE